MRKYVLLAVIITAPLPCAQAAGQVTSGVSITGIKVNPQGNGWNIVMTGTTTLGTGCTLTSSYFAFTDPNGNNLATILTWTQPAAGQTTNFTATLYTTTQGNWTGIAMLNFNTQGGGTGTVQAKQPFTVP